MNVPIVYVVISALSLIILLLFILLLHAHLSKPNNPLFEIQQKLGALENSAVQMQEIAKEVRNLNTLMHAPKLRGNFGEYLLYNMLSDTLPPKNFSTQYPFSDGTKVDAIIRLGNRIIPVDSKFPLESLERFINSHEAENRQRAKAEFIRSAKTRIDEISKKYIHPEEGTFDFALMYIPSENVYHEILTNDTVKGYEIFEYAMKKRVIPVSPNTFYAYLMAIVYGLKGMKIEEQAEVIIKKVEGLQKAFSDFNTEMATLGKHLTNASTKFTEVQERANKIGKQLKSLTE